MRENGALTGRKMWGQQSCMREWWWIPLQTILHLITFTARNKNKMQMHSFDFLRWMISPTFQVGSCVDWLFLTPQRAGRTKTTFDFLELALILATTLRPLKMERSLMAAWKETHHPHAAAEVTKTYFFYIFHELWVQRLRSKLSPTGWARRHNMT